MRFCCSLFFFFQAEDGIRDLTVTGVQTCALPISPDTVTPLWVEGPVRAHVSLHQDGDRFAIAGDGDATIDRLTRAGGERSEERRVGKECRSRWSLYL